MPADDPEVPARLLLELAADEPDGSPVIAAIPMPSLRPEETKPWETVLRADWAQMTERRDPLAWAVAELALR